MNNEWSELLNKIEVILKKNENMFTLGTVQLGLQYGVANTTGKPGFNEAVAIIQRAIEYGVTSIDTARAYGDAETAIGKALEGKSVNKIHVITKLDLLENLRSNIPKKDICLAVDTSIFSSCKELRTDQLQTLLLHCWTHRSAYNNSIWQKLLELKKEGIIKRLGASVYTPKEAIEAFNDPEICHIQIPFNILDWRWRASNFPYIARQRNNITIHTRSVLLQGVLSGDLSVWHKVMGGSQATKWFTKLNTLVQELGRKSRIDLCFAYVRAQPWITSVVVGVETMVQLHENVELFCLPPLTVDECKKVESDLDDAPEEFLNPANWRIR